jgi:hypothetical protein
MIGIIECHLQHVSADVQAQPGQRQLTQQAATQTRACRMGGAALKHPYNGVFAGQIAYMNMFEHI